MQRTVPVEDIGVVVLEDRQTSVTLPLLNALSDNNAAVIFCGDDRMPNAMLMNLDSNRTQGEKLGKDGERLKPYYRNVRSGDADNREGTAARIYWAELFGRDFVRMREGDVPNNLLNYGYTVLRAAVARSLMGSGLFPAFGIFHRNRYNAFPLADDVMEPYRPFVDELVYGLRMQGESQLTQEVKGTLLRILFADTRFEKVMRPLDVGLTFTAASLAKCFAGTQKKIVYPLLE